MKKIRYTAVVVVETCCTCGAAFGISEPLREALLTNGNGFYCPAGHRQYYSESTEKKLKEAQEQARRLEAQIASKDETLEWYSRRNRQQTQEIKDTKNKLRGQKATNTKLKKRIKNGVCPCCHRQFVNLQRHMQTKHPDYVGGGDEK